MIRARGLRKTFGEQVVLDGLDLDLAPGTVTALVGPNGSGKTTVGRILLGLTTPDAGTLHGLDGRRRAAVFQENRLCEQLSAVRNVRLVLDGGDRAARTTRAVAELRRVGLDDPSLRKPVLDLSGGQRRRVALVRALAGDADLVVLDEPFTGLDPESRAQALTYARARCAGRTVLLITHDPADAAWFGAAVVHLGA